MDLVNMDLHRLRATRLITDELREAAALYWERTGRTLPPPSIEVLAEYFPHMLLTRWEATVNCRVPPREEGGTTHCFQMRETIWLSDVEPEVGAIEPYFSAMGIILRARQWQWLKRFIPTVEG